MKKQKLKWKTPKQLEQEQNEKLVQKTTKLIHFSNSAIVNEYIGR
jgi:hypothetical protein